MLANMTKYRQPWSQPEARGPISTWDPPASPENKRTRHSLYCPSTTPFMRSPSLPPPAPAGLLNTCPAIVCQSAPYPVKAHHKRGLIDPAAFRPRLKSRYRRRCHGDRGRMAQEPGVLPGVQTAASWRHLRLGTLRLCGDVDLSSFKKGTQPTNPTPRTSCIDWYDRTQLTMPRATPTATQPLRHTSTPTTSTADLFPTTQR